MSQYGILHVRISLYTVFKVQGMIGECGVGGACSHIKAFGLSSFHIKREFCTEGLLGRRALGMLGRTLLHYTLVNSYTYMYSVFFTCSMHGLVHVHVQVHIRVSQHVYPNEVAVGKILFFSWEYKLLKWFTQHWSHMCRLHVLVHCTCSCMLLLWETNDLCDLCVYPWHNIHHNYYTCSSTEENRISCVKTDAQGNGLVPPGLGFSLKCHQSCCTTLVCLHIIISFDVDILIR